VAVIAREMFSREFKDLKEREKTTVLDTQMHERTWTNDHVMLRVFSIACTHKASGTVGSALCLAIIARRSFTANHSKPHSTNQLQTTRTSSTSITDSETSSLGRLMGE
jgi:hypothetical protein